MLYVIQILFDILHEFQNLLGNQSIKTQNSNLDKIIRNFSLNIFSNEQKDFTNLLLKINKDKFIIIDQYIEDEYKYKFGEDFFILCFDHSLILISPKIFCNFLDFVYQKEELDVYCYSNKIKQNIKSLKENIKFHNSKEDDFFKEINEFLQKFSFEHYHKSESIKNFCIVIQKSLFGYLLMKSYYNSKIDHSIQNQELFHNNLNAIQIEEDEYIILRYLNDGSSSHVFLIYHILTEKLYTLKVFDVDEKSDILFERELNNYSSISHPFFPRFYGTSHYLSYNCLVIEYIEGKTLNNFKEEIEKFNAFQRFKIFKKILKILKHIHNNKYIYRDLKLNNIIVNDNNQIFLIDFDRMIEESTTKNENYEFTKNFINLPPEIDNNGKFSYKSDIYMLGKNIINFLFPENYLKNEITAKELFDKCTDLNPELRPQLDEIIDEVYNNLGNFYYYGEGGVKQNYKKAKKYYESTTNNNKNSTALFNLGNIYFNGYGVDKNIMKAKEYFERSSKLNNPSALIYLGLIYASGNELNQNHLKEKEYYELSLKQNNSYALNFLGIIYENGYSVKQDFLKAKKYYELSSNLNDSDAFNNLGDLYYYGHGVKQDYYKAKEYYELSAKQNDSDALNNLGNLYKEGHGVVKNYSKAKEYYELASKLNNSDAFNNLGDLYYYGFGVKQDYLKAKEYYELSAKLNDSNALNNLGNLYKNGFGVKKDYLKAKEYYEISSKLNDSNALNNLGDLYYYGHGIKRDYLKAKEYYELSSKLNDSYAFNYLGNLYYYGYEVEQDYIKAKEYYELASRLKNADALNSLGNLYYYGHGVKQNYKKAKEYYELSAQQNNPHAYFNLANLYYNGHVVKQDLDKANEYIELSSKINKSFILIYLGNLHYYGHGVKKDHLKAKEYYALSLKSSNSNTLYNLGNIYKNGHIIKQSYLKAKEYYELSAKLNNSSALYNLGNLYYNGTGVEKDYLRAKEYYELSAKLNNSFALNNLGDLYKDGQGVKKDYLKAKEYYELSSKLNDFNALNNLGDLYFHGLGVEQNYQKAKEYYELSAKQNNPVALYNLGNLYENGYSVEQDYMKAKEYYELSSYQNDPGSLLKLAKFYSDGDIFEANFDLSIKYYKKCIEFHFGEMKTYDLVNHCYIYTNTYNKYYYHSNNDLGLIYLTVFQDIEKALIYIKEAALNEYPFGQNNYGLMYQLYLNHNIINAEYFYQRSSKNHFALSNYNLGYLKEIDGKIIESIEYFIKASDDEDEPLIFHGWKYHDKRLEISKTFVICYTNLKLSEYYFSNSNFSESKKYFTKAFSKLITNDKYPFKFRIYQEEKDYSNFEYLKFFILNFPSFNLINQPTLNSEIKKKIESIKNVNVVDNNQNKEIIKNSKLNNYNEKEIQITKLENEFEDTNKLFEFIISDENLKKYFIEEIKSIICLMKEILYTPPYAILFGRINIEKTKVKENLYPHRINLNQSFYEGFALD